MPKTHTEALALMRMLLARLENPTLTAEEYQVIEQNADVLRRWAKKAKETHQVFGGR